MTSRLEDRLVAVTKRTTMRIEEDLLIEIRHRAQEERVSMNRMINRLLRRGLHLPEEKRRKFRQRTFDLGKPRVDITKTSAVLSALDDERYVRRSNPDSKPEQRD
jgi:hypothetical protein